MLNCVVDGILIKIAGIVRSAAFAGLMNERPRKVQREYETEWIGRFAAFPDESWR